MDERDGQDTSAPAYCNKSVQECCRKLRRVQALKVLVVLEGIKTPLAKQGSAGWYVPCHQSTARQKAASPALALMLPGRPAIQMALSLVCLATDQARTLHDLQTKARAEHYLSSLLTLTTAARAELCKGAVLLTQICMHGAVLVLLPSSELLIPQQSTGSQSSVDQSKQHVHDNVAPQKSPPAGFPALPLLCTSVEAAWSWPAAHHPTAA